jgi:hypothetical protein
MDLDSEAEALDYTLADIIKDMSYYSEVSKGKGGTGGRKKKGTTSGAPVSFEYIEYVSTGEWATKSSGKAVDPFESWGKVLWKLAHYSLYDDSSTILRKEGNDESPIPPSWFRDVPPAVKETATGKVSKKTASIWSTRIEAKEFTVTSVQYDPKRISKVKEEKKYLLDLYAPSLDFGQWLKQIPPWTLWMLAIFYIRHIPHHLIQTLAELEGKKDWIPKVIPYLM